MRLAIMQPYFLPYIGYWQLLNIADKFIVYDNIQYTKKGWINRNNILLNNKSFLFSLPLKKDKDYLNINERRLSDISTSSTIKTLRQIKNAYKKAPYFYAAFPVVEKIFNNKAENLFKYIYYSIEEICNYLDIETEVIVSSSVDIDHRLKGQDKVIAICKQLDADLYINSLGGAKLYEKDKFEQEGVKLDFIIPSLIEYRQYGKDFTPGLSIIDLIMFNSVDEVKRKLNEYTMLYGSTIT